jgi:hypothetical protein
LGRFGSGKGLDGFGRVGLPSASRSATRARIDAMVKPRGSTLPGCHSKWPMTLRSLQPWERHSAAAAFSIASSWACGQGSSPSPRFTHSKP